MARLPLRTLKSASRMKRNRWSILQDLGGVLALTSLCIGLGYYARCGTRLESAASSVGEPAAQTPAHPVFSLEQLRQYVDTPGGLVLDARPADEYAQGHIPGALSLPQPAFEQQFDRIKDRLEPFKTTVIVVYCSDLWCGLADEVQQRLAALGFKHVARYPDGWHGWTRASLPIEKSP